MRRERQVEAVFPFSVVISESPPQDIPGISESRKNTSPVWKPLTRQAPF